MAAVVPPPPVHLPRGLRARRRHVVGSSPPPPLNVVTKKNSSQLSQFKFVCVLGFVLLLAHCMNIFAIMSAHWKMKMSVNVNYPSHSKLVKAPSLRMCTLDELDVIKSQLPPDDCLTYRGEPWLQKCSMSYATRCKSRDFSCDIFSVCMTKILFLSFHVPEGPDAVWLESYYMKLHSLAPKSIPSTFLAMFVGCNKGFDAVNAIRMGSGNPVFDKSAWKDAITHHGKMTLHADVCNEITHEQFALSLGNNVPVKDDAADKGVHLRGGGGGGSPSFAQVHCIEPMPTTALGECICLKNDTSFMFFVHSCISSFFFCVPKQNFNERHQRQIMINLVLW
jgi:hypothetical protein